MTEHRIADACCLQGRSSGVRHDADSSEEDTIDTPQSSRAEAGKPHREQVRLAFGELFTGGAFDMGRICVECKHCDAMLWVCECNKVSARSLAVSPGSLTASLMLSAV